MNDSRISWRSASPVRRLAPERVEHIDRAAVPAPLELPDQPEDRRVPAGADLPVRHDPGDRHRAGRAAAVAARARPGASDRSVRMNSNGQSARDLDRRLARPGLASEQRARRHVVGRERVAALQREPPAQRAAARLSAREPTIEPAIRSVWWRSETASGFTSAVPCTPCSRSQRLSAPASPRMSHSVVFGPVRLDEAEHLAQRAELVEVAAEELRRRVVVRVDHARRAGGRPSRSRPRSARARAAGPRRRGRSRYGTRCQAQRATAQLTSDRKLQRPGKPR